MSNSEIAVADKSITPDFIYGGPFIHYEKIDPIIDMATPRNLPLQGTFKQSFAYYTLKERLPIILTKVIDYASREGRTIKSQCNASDADIKNYMQYITKLKSDLITNKKYDPLVVDTPEAKRWNSWIDVLDHKNYFLNTLLFTECYVYRRLREAGELSGGLKDYDPFSALKAASVSGALEPMCIVAEKVYKTMLTHSEKDKQKADFVTLLKVSLWANKNDLALTAGDQVSPDNTVGPFEMVLQLKSKLLVDQAGKFFDKLYAKAQTTLHQWEATQAPTEPTSQDPEAKPADAEAPPEANHPPCPSKLKIPSLTFDIVCDNAGYELFTDLCVGHFLIAQEIVKKVRFHVKAFGWFVSDVTEKDFQDMINACITANYSREKPPKTPPKDGEVPEVEVINSEALNALGEQWKQFLEDGFFVVWKDDFYTSPHPYKDMKAQAPGLYRVLQQGVGILFKGDLNYRKLLADINLNPTTPFDKVLQGFKPALLCAVRTVKSDIICGLPNNKWDQLNKLDANWMRKGDYGVIQFFRKKPDALKVSDMPCQFYGRECEGISCPHT